MCDSKLAGSLGCKHCQQGDWLCIFLTYKCGANCYFCPAPSKDDTIVSALGSEKVAVFRLAKEYNFEGISFSGGDPFTVPERFLDWLIYGRKILPEAYYWAYTCGINVNEKVLEKIAEAGLDELRFNTAATGYNNPEVLKTIEHAAKIFKTVTVEIPSIPVHFEQLISSLQQLVRVGVKHLNLHEYMLTPSNPDFNLPEKLFSKLSIDVHFHAKSIENTRKIVEYVQQNKLPISVNNCSLIAKEQQMKMRRQKMGNIFIQPHETLTDDGFYETYLPLQDIITEAQIPELAKSSNGFSKFWQQCVSSAPEIGLEQKAKTILKLSYVPPMMFTGKRVLKKVEILKD